MARKRVTRRAFLKGSLATAAGVMIVPRHVLGGQGYTPPSETITRGVIGTGGQGMGAHVVANREGEPPVCLAVCDVDRGRVQSALNKAGAPCEGYTDFRRVLDRRDIDTIHIATPPHWHALISIAAAQAGKDILCEKPMTRFIGEGRAVVDAVLRYGRVFQIGTYGRFSADRSLRKLMRSGVLGDNRPCFIVRQDWKVQLWSGRTDLVPQRVPAELDYDLWLGPAPLKPYHRHRTHGSFRGYWDYDGGGLSDMGQHYLDGVQYSLDKDETGPVEIEARAPWPPHPDAVGLWGWVRMRYADGTTIVLDSGEWGERYPEQPRWPKGEPQLTPPQREILENTPDPEPLVQFHDAVRTRQRAGGHAESSHRGATLLHLANAAIRLGRRLQWDPRNERFVNDEEANRFVHQPMRAPWHL